MDIKKLKKVIQEAVPEIMELGFGCGVYPNMDGDPWFNHRVWQVVAVADRKLILRPSGNNIDTDLQSVDIKYIKILGRPITLHDIRLALIKNSDDWGDCFREVSAMWNEIDNLDEQSDICKSLLIRILVN